MTTLDESRDHAASTRERSDAEALIKEARKLRRRRYLSFGVAFLVMVAGVAAGVFLSQGGGRQTPSGGSHTKEPPPTTVPHQTTIPVLPAAVAPRQPGPLALSADGDLYIADDGLNEVLVRMPNGQFQVVAGTGKAGFSGDGGPATLAELDGPSGLAIGADGTLYIADNGNNRVRAVLPDGTITTIAGNGQPPTGPPWTPVMGSPATQTAIGPTYSVATASNGTLYIATSNTVLSLTAEGELSIVTDGASFAGFPPPFPFSGGCGPESLAVDGTGDLFIGCSDPYDLVERTPDGTLHNLGLSRPHDAFSALAGLPSGGVLAVDGAGVVQYNASGQQAVVSYLSYRLPDGKPFWPQGIAVSSNGTLFLSQDGISGIGPPAIVERDESDTSSELWSPGNTPS